MTNSSPDHHNSNEDKNKEFHTNEKNSIVGLESDFISTVKTLCHNHTLRVREEEKAINRDKLKTIESENYALKTVLEDQKMECKSLQLKLDNSNNLVALLTKENNKLNELILSSLKSITNAVIGEAEIKKKPMPLPVSSEHVDTQNASVKTNQSVLSLLKKILDSTKVQNADLNTDELQSLNQRNQELSKANADLTQQFKEKEKEMNILYKQNEELQKKLTKSTERLKAALTSSSDQE